MKFNDYKYIRPDLKQLEKSLKNYLKEFVVSDAKGQIKIIKELFDLLDEVESMYTIASIRNSINTKDPFYEEENKYLDANFPPLMTYLNELNKLAYNSQYKKELI